jgi:hypothetical protein
MIIGGLRSVIVESILFGVGGIDQRTKIHRTANVAWRGDGSQMHLSRILQTMGTQNLQTHDPSFGACCVLSALDLSQGQRPVKLRVY